MESSLSTRLRIFPDGFRGSASMSRTSLGTLKRASRPLQCRASSFGVVVAWARNTTYAIETSPPAVVGTDDDGCLQHRLVLVQDALDLGARGVLTAGHEHVLEPIDDVEVAVVIHHAEVAGVEPAAVERRPRCVRIPPVALEHLRSAQDDLAAFTGGHRGSMLVPDVELEVLAGPPDASELRQRALSVEEGIASWW
jgi:hypothetical protein